MAFLRCSRLLVKIPVLFLLCALHVHAQPVLETLPSGTGVHVDGALSEPVWAQAPAASDFRQFEPAEGAVPRFRTEVRVLYGPTALFIGATLHDDAPDEIQQTLGRRDEINRADWFVVSLDSYLDRKTAYVFGISAAGVQYDAVRSSSENEGGPTGPLGIFEQGLDPSWDAIWASAVRKTPDGWTAELRIPYSMLRFAENDVATWGIHCLRRIPRLAETDEWPMVPRTQRVNMVANFGQLTGLKGISPRRNVQVRPYVLARMRTEEDAAAPGTTASSGSTDLGGDVKVGLGPNMTLDATINPDFGQVEADPAVLNLTAFETFFEERRPFFVEGISIYQFSAGPGQLLYTRRIGADAPIIGAGKLSGRTAGGLSYGLLGATTGHNFNPDRNYGVVRVSQQLGAYSSAGGVVTAYDAPGLNRRHQSLVAGADYDIRFLQNRFGFEGFAATSRRVLPDGTHENGFAGKFWTRKRQGAWTGFIGIDYFDAVFNPNDLGQLPWNNALTALLSVDHEVNGGRPFGPFQRLTAGTFNLQQFSADERRDIGMELEFFLNGMLKGYQPVELELGVLAPFGGYDLFETRGLGPWNRQTVYTAAFEIGTDERRLWSVEPDVRLEFQEGGGRGVNVALRGDWSLGSRLSLFADVATGLQNRMLAWSSNESFRKDGAQWFIGRPSAPPSALSDEDYLPFDDEGRLEAALSGRSFESPGRHYVPVFGLRDTRSLDATLRSDVTLTPHLSVQLYGQLFVARGRYRDFQLLRDPDTLVPFEPYPKRDEFGLHSLNVNSVLRWEYRPGSTLFLVWAHGRRGDDRLNPLAPWGRSPYDVPTGRQITDTFGLFPNNAFIIKINYVFLR